MFNFVVRNSFQTSSLCTILGGFNLFSLCVRMMELPGDSEVVKQMSVHTVKQVPLHNVRVHTCTLVSFNLNWRQ